MNFLSKLGNNGRQAKPFHDLQNIRQPDDEQSGDEEGTLFQKENYPVKRNIATKPAENALKKKPVEIKRPALALDLGKLQEDKENQFVSSSRSNAPDALSSRQTSPSNNDGRFLTSRSASIDPLTARTASRVPSEYSLPTSRQPSRQPSFEDLQIHSAITPEVSDEDEQEEQDEDEAHVDYVFSKARHNRIEEVKEAFRKGFDVNARDQHGNTLLHICAQNNHVRLAGMLVQMKAGTININARNLKMLTPLDFAERYHFEKMKEWLLERGGQSGAANSQFRTKFR